MKKVQNSIMRPCRSVLTAFTMLLAAVFLSGCSAARFGYSNGETLSYWWLDSYIEFNNDQRQWVKQELADLFAWHRKTQLQGYVQFLKRAQARVHQPVTEAELQRDYDEIRKHTLVLADKALPALADLALSLSPSQIDNIEKKFASNNENYRKEHLRGSLEKRQRSRAKKVVQQAESWFGNFTPEQEQQIRALSDARPLDNELVLTDRIRRQAALLALLRKIQADKPSHPATMALLRNHMLSVLDRSYNPEHKSFFEANQASTIHMLAQIINGATPAQKANFTKTAQKWINDFNALMG